MSLNTYSHWLPILEKLGNDSNLFNLVKRCPLEIMQQWNIHYFKKDAIIFQQNKIYDEFNIVLEGKANVYVQSSDDKKYQQAKYHCGDIIGELEVFERKPYVCTVEAETDLILLNVSRDNFLKWLELDSHFNRQLLFIFSQQYYQLAQKAAEDSLYSLHQRICNHLINTAKQECQHTIQVNKKNLSNQFAVTIRSINRVFQHLKELNIIEMQGEKITIIDMQQLVQQA